MSLLLDKFKIVHNTETTFNELNTYCSNVDELIFFRNIDEKWSIAENLIHLIKTTKITLLALRVPKFILRLKYGKPNRPSLSYEELMSKYSEKLEAGNKSPEKFVPKNKDLNTTKDKIIESWKDIAEAYLNRLRYYWDDEILDQYLVPHPLLGKLTMREMAYFTIYHTKHHFKAIRQRNREAIEIPAA